MTLGSTPVKPNPNPCHHVYSGWDSSYVFEVLAIGPNMTIVELFGSFLPNEKGVIWWGITPLAFILTL